MYCPPFDFLVNHLISCRENSLCVILFMNQLCSGFLSMERTVRENIDEKRNSGLFFTPHLSIKRKPQEHTPKKEKEKHHRAHAKKRETASVATSTIENDD